MDIRAFLQGQIRVLDTPIKLSSTYESPGTSEHVSMAVIEKVSEQVSEAIRAHNRIAYAAEATSILAEQVEFAWHSMRARARLPEAKDAVPFDPTDDNASEQLLADWSPGVPSRENRLETFAETQRHTQLRDKLVALKKTREEKEAALGLLERLVSETSVLELPSQNLQAELATRDSEIAKELSRMNFLLRRANRKILIED